ncbi:MAG: acyl-CoA/acyl-ACP dehydrogenase [Actinobacteria bacterium]|nr:acyl-CoA/acyl-ACP dehydrogenase [Actinomycetota bacterium]
MDFKLTEEQEFFRQTIADTVDRMVMPKVEHIDEHPDDFPWDLWKEFTSLGYLGLRYPEEVGGMEADTTTCMLFYQELARASAGFSMAVTMNMLMGTYFLHRFGSEDIVNRLMVPAIRGEKIGVICFTEDQSGSDVGATRTTATKVDDGWVINGVKTWITNGPICDFCTVICQTDPSKGSRGLDFFLIERGMEGFSSGQILHKMGAQGPITGELIFDNVLVPEDHFLGDEVGRGVQHLTDILNEVRCMTAASAIGIATTAMNDALEYARARKAFGRTIGDYQLIREKFARIAMNMEASKLMVYRTAWMIDEEKAGRGPNPREEAFLTKMFATEMCMECVDEVMRIYGGNAFAREYGPQRYFRDARFLLYGGGTHEIIKDFIGGQMIRGRWQSRM